MDLALRNLHYAEEILKEKIKDQSLFENNGDTTSNLDFTVNVFTVNTFTINSNAHSLEDYYFNEDKRRKNSIRINNSAAVS